MKSIKDKHFVDIINHQRISSEGKVYTLDYIENLLEFYEEKEEYEKCSSLIEIIKEIRNHNSQYHR